LRLNYFPVYYRVHDRKLSWWRHNVSTWLHLLFLCRKWSTLGELVGGGWGNAAASICNEKGSEIDGFL